jgi:hypothetical protein
MIRLTVLYNLPPNSDEEEFLKWRLTDHQEANASLSGTIGTDFSRFLEQWPSSTPSPYRFMTNIDWPDMSSFRQSFLDPQVQKNLKQDLDKMADPIFLISEVLIDQKKENNNE